MICSTEGESIASSSCAASTFASTPDGFGGAGFTLSCGNKAKEWRLSGAFLAERFDNSSPWSVVLGRTGESRNNQTRSFAESLDVDD